MLLGFWAGVRKNVSLTLELSYLRSVKSVMTCTTLAIQDLHSENPCPQGDGVSYGSKPRLFFHERDCLRWESQEKMNLDNLWGDASADPSSAWASKRRPKARDQVESGGSRA